METCIIRPLKPTFMTFLTGFLWKTLKKKKDENIMKLYYWIGRGHFKAFYSIYNTNEVNEISDSFNSTVWIGSRLQTNKTNVICYVTFL